MATAETYETPMEMQDAVALDSIPEGARFTIALPDLDSAESIDTFNTELKKGEALKVYGIRSLASHWKSYNYHIESAEGHWADMCVNVASVNGERSARQKYGDKKISARKIAQGFYESLNTPMLRSHCQVLGVAYDSFDTQEEIIAAMVDRHIELSL
jgi:hypothetical protein